MAYDFIYEICKHISCHKCLTLFVVCDVIILDYWINVHIRKAVCILLSFDSVYMHVFADDNTA